MVGVTIGGDATFDSATLSGATLKNSVISSGGSFNAATLTGANLNGTDILGEFTFDFAPMTGASLRAANIAGDSSFELRNPGRSEPDQSHDQRQRCLQHLQPPSDDEPGRGPACVNATISGSDDFDFADLTGADLAGAIVTGPNDFQNALFSNTICPDGTNSDNDGGTCFGHGIS